MKSNINFLGVLMTIAFLLISCQKQHRNPYPEELVGGMELLSPEITKIDFKNTITESAS